MTEVEIKRWQRPLPRTEAQMRENPEHDAHVVRWEQQLCQDWLPEPVSSEDKILLNQFIEARPAALTRATDEDLYVIACSDSMHHLYWHQSAGWCELVDATQFTTTDRLAMPEPQDGFWMPLVRAQELDE